jgi:hypothetical protein
MNANPTVTPIPGEAGRYYSSAEVSDERYIVDLLADNGNGECGCIDYSIRCRTNLLESDGEFVDYINLVTCEKNPGRTICKHIHKARSHYTQATLSYLSCLHRADVVS